MRLVAMSLRLLSFTAITLALALLLVACQDLTPETTTTEQSTTTSTTPSSDGTTAPAAETKTYMPGLVGLSESEAKARLDALSVDYDVKASPTTDSGKIGKVTAQDVPEGTEITAGMTVQISVGRTGVEVPKLKGLPDYDAKGWVESLGLKISITDDPPRDPSNPTLYVVTSQSPDSGSIVLEGTTVKVTCGPEF